MSHNYSKFLFVVAAIAVVTLLSASSGAVTVTNTTELVNAVNAANASGGNYDINLEAGTYTLTAGMFALDDQSSGTVQFIGAGRDNTIIDGNGTSGVFQLVYRNFVFKDLTIRNGNSTGSGGAIIQFEGSLTLNNVAVKNNTARIGGGIYSYGSNHRLELINSFVLNNIALGSVAGIYVSGGTFVMNGSTVSGNNVSDSGGGGGIYITSYNNAATSATITNSTIDFNQASGFAGIYCDQHTTLDLLNSTISNNISGVTANGSGIYVNGSTVNIASSTITGNITGLGEGGGGVFLYNSNPAVITTMVTIKNSILASNTAPDCYGMIVSGGYNLIENVSGCTGTVTSDKTGVSALLESLADNGGATKTQMPLASSPIIDAGNPAGCTDNSGAPLSTDQRGFARSSGAACDIGAVEVGCGDGIVESFIGEVCDTAIPGSCPATCDDSVVCTTDTLNSGGTCSASCSNTPITTCTHGDGCCAPSCNNNNDSDCSVTCGNGVREVGEDCDTTIAAGQLDACPTTCNDNDVSTTDTLTGTGCQTKCNYQEITTCTSGDGYCPVALCNSFTDSDCSPVCGNELFEAGEICDIAITTGRGSCRESCDDGVGCTADITVDEGTCTESCYHPEILDCKIASDGCCPAGCNSLNDADCSPTCGNGVIENGEVCDTGVASVPGACPTTCDDGMACTDNVLVAGGGCSAACTYPEISECRHDDGCCTPGCNSNNDNDCSPTCGNGVLEVLEVCDTTIAFGQPGACPASCNDFAACTTDTLIADGSCSAVCSNQQITTCKGGDGCCAPGCNNNNDSDCEITCGNGALEFGEICDTAISSGQLGSCLTSCNDSIVCTTDALIAASCQTTCSNQEVTICKDGDGCCPTGCNTTNDRDCSPTCGNGLLEAGEVCDTGVASGQTSACPTSCSDEDVCTADILVARESCSAVCGHQQITTCITGDGCCPTGCTNPNDGDCTAEETTPAVAEQPPETPPATEQPTTESSASTASPSAGCSMIALHASGPGFAGWFGFIIPVGVIALRRRIYFPRHGGG